jgi:hypothetical protein
MASIPFWDNGPTELLALLDDLSAQANAWNILTIAGERLPGLVNVPTGALERSVDVKKPLGAKAATIAFHGDDPAKPEWELTLWTPKQWDRYQEMLPLIQPRKPDAYPQPVSASHPTLALHGITAIFFTKVGFPQIKEGICTIALSAMEWVPKPKPVKNSGAGGAGPSLEQRVAKLEALEAQHFPPSAAPPGP